MSANLSDSAIDLARDWASSLASSVASMTMAETPPAVVSAGQVTAGDLNGYEWFRCEFDGARGSLFAGATGAAWSRLGRTVLEVAGLTDSSEDEARSTAVEILAQAASGLAQALARRLGRPVTAHPMQPAALADLPAEAAFRFTVESGESSLSIAVMTTTTLATTVAPAIAQSSPSAPLPAAVSRTADLLLEVEMPVSVSFGRAQLPLRDILKLNSGSIVELNRTINEPVEVIVNNCVIARGEVVVVDGNYGVRIQHVVSKEERLRTLS